MIQGDKLFVLSVASAFCILILTGLFLYSGSIFPTHKGGTLDGIIKFGLWSLFVIIPLFTSILLLLKLKKK